MMKRIVSLLYFCYMACVLMACSSEDYLSDLMTTSAGGQFSFRLPKNITRGDLLTDISIGHQSAACYNNDVFFVADALSSITMYSLTGLNIIKRKSLPIHREKTLGGNTLFHCNQSTFSKRFYEQTDEYPLLYISERNDSLKRCFIEVFRIVAPKDEYGSVLYFTPTKVQRIYLPAMTKNNALGNANLVVDSETGNVYTYSRNNTKDDSNYLKCRITRWRIPEDNSEIVYLSETDIIESFEIGCSANAMQGACIHDGFLYIGQGYANQGKLRIVDLQDKKLVKTVDLKQLGYLHEPEGCFWYNGNLLISSTTAIYSF